MKKNLTRVLALAMALLMCLSLLPVSALAMTDPAAILASAQAAQAAAMGGAAPDVPFVMPDQALDYTDPNACLASEDGQHLWIEVHDPAYICAWGDCTEENPHILYKSCAYCKQSAEPLYANELEAIQNEAQVFAETQEEIPPEQYDDWDYRAYHKYIFELPDHFYEKQDGQAPTCTAGGHTAYEQCSVCEEIRGYEELDPLGHNWGEYTVTVEPTCTAAGTKMRECLRCGEKEYADIPALGHDWGEFVTVKEPTCTETGTTKRVCERCSAEDFGEIPANGHSYGDFTILKEATCTEDGSKEHTCTVCEYTETVVIPAAHTWGDFTVTKEATCTEAGEQEHICTVCNVTETVAIPAKDHSYGEDGVCTVCGAEKPVEPTVVEEPTVEEPVVEEPKEEESKKEESEKEPAGAQPVGAIVEDCRDMYSSFGAFLAEQNAADAKYVVASYTPVDANGHALGEIPAGGVRFDLPLPEGADAASVQVYTYDYSTYSWSPANFFLSDGQATVSSGAYPYPPFAVLAAPAASGNGGETTPTKQEASSEETVNEFKNLMNEKGISDGSGEIVAQHVTPLHEDGTEMPNEEVAERGGVYFEMDLPEGFEEGDTLNIGHRNSETGEWEIITDYEIKGDKAIIHVTHFSDIVMELQKGGGKPALLGAAGGGNFSDPVIKKDGVQVSVAKVGEELTVESTPDASTTVLVYTWRRKTSNDATPTTIKSGKDDNAKKYTLTNDDCPYDIYCLVHEEGHEETDKLSTGVHVRMDVPFETTVKGAGAGTAVIKKQDGRDPSSSPVYINYPATQSPFNIDALTEDAVTITVTPDSTIEHNMLRSVTEGTTTLISATKESASYTITSVKKEQATHGITIFFDTVECAASEAPTTPKDNEYASDPTIKNRFVENYVKTDCLSAYYYITPKWSSFPGDPLLKAEITAAGGFSPEMDLPALPSGKTYDDYSIKVYHYDGEAAMWKEAAFEKVPDEAKVRLKNQTEFSPFGIVLTPSVKLTLNAGDGSGTMTPNPIATTKGGTVTVPQSTFTAPANKTFDYWEGTINEAHPDGKYQAGEVLTLADDLTLTAKWAGGFTVTFNKNDNYPGLTGTAEGDMPQQFVKESDEEAGTAKLNANQFTLKNHTFKGWSKTPGNKAPDFATDFKDQDKLNTTTYHDQTDLTLYAVWQRTHVSVSYNANGGSGTMAEQHAPVDSSLPLSANKFTAPASNMMFAGWSKDSPTGNIDFKDGETVDVADDLNNTDVTLYAIWREKVTIHFSPESTSGTGTGTMSDQTVPSGAPTALKKNTFKAPSTAMAFAGWNDRQDGNGNDYVDGGEYSFNGDVYLYAQWGPAITITYEPNSSDASGSMDDQKVAANESFKLNELGYTNPAATFMGWAKTSTGTPEYDKPGEPDSKTVTNGFSENTTLYAIWDKHAFTGTVRITGSDTGSADKAIVGETLTANVTGESEFTEFRYQWLKNGAEIPGATEQTYEPTSEDAGQTITCQAWAEDSPDKNKKTSINSKTVGIEDSEEKIINNGQLKRAIVHGVYPGMYVTLNNQPVGTLGPDTGEGVELTQQGVYRFYTGSDKKTLLGTVVVTNWYTVGYVNATSTSTTSTSTSTGSSNAGSGTITAKATYDGTERTLTTSTTIKDTLTGETVLEPYSVPGFSHVWIAKQDSDVGFYLTVRPSSGSYGHVSVNNGGYDSSSAERTYRVDPVNTYAMYSIIFNRSSTSPRTADDSHLGLWSALCFLSLAGATVLLNGQRKRRKARR